MNPLDIFEDVDYYNNIFSFDSLQIPLRYLRDADNPYSIDATSFKKRYRFSQGVVKNVILPLIMRQPNTGTNRGLPIPPEIEILVCLRFYATASFQIVAGDLLHVSQPAVSRIVEKISKKLAEQHTRFIKYPANMAAYHQQFLGLGRYRQHQGLRHVDGAIDCTHVKIVNTPGVQHHEAYRNRKSYFSINVQAIVGPDCKFLDIVARWAGSTHDSRIFQLSMINQKYRQQVHRGYLVGDSGYPSLPYLLTPVHNPTPGSSEELYNKIHVKTRIVVERSFGMWKRRFPCLSRGLGNKLSTVSAIIISCAVLHNISIEFNDSMPDEEEVYEEEIEEETPATINTGTADGFAVRAAIISELRL